VTAVDGDGRPALTHAAIGGWHGVMLRLLQADGADLSTADTAYGRHTSVGCLQVKLHATPSWEDLQPKASS